jgi:hypothetical protein
LLLCSSYLPLGVPNWTVIYIIIATLSNELEALESMAEREKSR